MSSLIHLRSAAELVRRESDWNSLWQRSAVTLPTTQAAMVAQWQALFGERRPQQTLIAERGGHWIAGLALVETRLARLLAIGAQPSNDWGLCGDFLLDEARATAHDLDLFVQSLAQLPWPAVCLNDALLDTPRWQQLIAACERLHMPHHVQAQLEIARLEMQGDWTAYRASLSKSHRQATERQWRRLGEQGPVSLEWHEPNDPLETAALLQRGFRLEQQSWKGTAGTAILNLPHIHAYLVQQAQFLAAGQHLRVAFLKMGEADVAFVYGWEAKGTLYLFKTAFDATFAARSPGQLLLYGVLERAFQTPGVRAVDFLTTLKPGIAHWRPATYRVGRLHIAPRGGPAGWLVRAHRQVWQPLRNWWQRPATNATSA